MSNFRSLIDFSLLTVGIWVFLILVSLATYFWMPAEYQRWVYWAAGVLAVAAGTADKIAKRLEKTKDATPTPPDASVQTKVALDIGGDVSGQIRSSGRDFISPSRDSIQIGTQYVQSTPENVTDYLLKRITVLEAEVEAHRGSEEQLQAAKREMARLRSENIQKSVRLADEYYRRERWEECIEETSQLLQHLPGAAFLYSNRGIAYDNKGDPDAAIADFNRAIERAPEFAGVYTNRGATYAKKGDLDTAIADFSKAIALDPEFAIAYYNRGNAYGDKGDPDAATADYNRAIDLDPEFAIAYNNRGNAHRRKGNLGAAIADFNRAIGLNPKDFRAYYNRGYAHFENRDLASALADFETYCKLETCSAVGHNNRGYLLFRLGRTSKAEATWRTATGLPDAPHYAFAGHAIALHKMGRHRKAIGQYCKAIDMDVRWRDNVSEVAEEFNWTEEMVALAREIIQAL